MREQIRRLGADTAVYGISTIVGRFLNFLLVPIYTHVLPPGEYGIVAYVYSIIAFVTIIYGYGMESAYFKYASTKELGDDRANFSTPFLSLLVTSGLLSLLIETSEATSVFRRLRSGPPSPESPGRGVPVRLRPPSSRSPPIL